VFGAVLVGQRDVGELHASDPTRLVGPRTWSSAP
jgi:hypothetical protein